jgi:hypothetical protein
LRGEKDEARYQNEIRMGIEVKIPKKIEVFNPPPSFHEKYVGTNPRREKRTRLEKLSEPGPSAGRGAFLMAGYYQQHLLASN